MSPVSQLSLLAFASAVLATPYGHGHGHALAHRHLHTGSGAPYPLPSANATGIHGSAGTGVASYPAPTETLTNTDVDQNTKYETLYSTIHLAYQSGSAAPAYGSASEQCGADVTVTSTEKVYVTVTAGEASSSAVAAVGSSAGPSTVHITSTVTAPGSYGSSSSSKAVPVSSSAASAPAYSAPAYSSSSSSSSSEAAPVASSSAPAPAYTPLSSSEAAPVSTSSLTSVHSAPASSSSSAADIVPSVYSAANKGAEKTATASAPATYSSAVSSGGKRGLAYNSSTVDLVECFSGSTEVSWAYNWVSSSDSLSGFTYIPTLHSNDAAFTGSWKSDAQSAIDNGASVLFSFNEPDISSQANMDVATAVTAWNTYMQPFAGKAKLCAPAVSNAAQSGMGLSYLQNFLDSCTGCTIDCLAIHWYGEAVNSDFTTHLDSAVGMLKDNQTLYVNEFAATGSDSEVNSFLQDVMPAMDSNDKVAGYAYFMIANGMLVSGSEPSTYGSTYMSYKSS